MHGETMKVIVDFDLPQNTSNFTMVDLARRSPVEWLLSASATDSLCNTLHSV